MIKNQELTDKEKIAIERLQTFEPPEGYYLAFSGGKDSIIIYRLAEMAGVKFDAHYNLTTVDPPELVKSIKRNYPNVEIHKPEFSMWELIQKTLMPPTRKARYCCDILKERGGIGRFVVTGIRWTESRKRQKRKMIHGCLKSRIKKYIHPIIDWTCPTDSLFTRGRDKDDIWGFIARHNLEYCSLYDEGFTRLGCIMCPMQGTKGMIRDANRYPKYYKMYLLAFDKMLKAREEKGKKTDTWKNAEEVMKWWVYNRSWDKNQMTMFE